MSCTNTYQAKLLDTALIAEAARVCGATCKIAEAGGTLTERLHAGPEVGIASVRLPKWRYPIVIKDDGNIRADTYEGSWGDAADLDRLSREYARAGVLRHTNRIGHRVLSTREEADGTLLITTGH